MPQKMLFDIFEQFRTFFDSSNFLNNLDRFFEHLARKHEQFPPKVSRRPLLRVAFIGLQLLWPVVECMRKTVLTIYVFHNRNSNRVRNFVYSLFRKTLLRNSAHTRLLLRFRTAPSFSNRLIYYRSYRRKVGSRDGSAASLVRLHDSGSSQNGHHEGWSRCESRLCC